MNSSDEGFQTNPAIPLYLSQEHACSYLEDKAASIIYFDPSAEANIPIYQWLVDRGFRRSGNHIYRPACPSCHACVPLRLPVSQFKPNRSQRRCWKRNNPNITVIDRPSEFDQEQFNLYQRYTKARHNDGNMANFEPNEYMGFLASSWSETVFFEFRIDSRLVAVAISDLLPDGLSSTYTFYNPDLSHLGLGIYCLLWQIEQAQQRGLQWLYPGYWIKECTKMNYKDKFRPIEAWSNNKWNSYKTGEPLAL